MKNHITNIKQNKLFINKTIAFIILFSFIILNSTNAARIKDIATFDGFSSSQVIGYGLVVGLNQTGDNQLSSYTNQSIVNMLKRFGLTSEQRNNRTRNVAAVMVTATIPTFTKIGQKIDVVVSSMGDATSLQGGTLLMSTLSISNGKVIGNAQGPVTVGGYDVRSLGSQVSRNMTTSGRVPNGLILSENIEGQFVNNQQLKISLRNPDFSNIARMTRAINQTPGLQNSATPIDASSVQIQLPNNLSQIQLMDLIERIESIDIENDLVAKVVINERTGTIVVGGNVEILPTVVAHGGLDITIERQLVVPQPAPFTILPPRIGETANIEAKEEKNQVYPLTIVNSTVENMAASLNLLQVKPRDLIAIFQALKESGALQAELVIQ